MPWIVHYASPQIGATWKDCHVRSWRCNWPEKKNHATMRLVRTGEHSWGKKCLTAKRLANDWNPNAYSEKQLSLYWIHRWSGWILGWRAHKNTRDEMAQAWVGMWIRPSPPARVGRQMILATTLCLIDKHVLPQMKLTKSFYNFNRWFACIALRVKKYHRLAEMRWLATITFPLRDKKCDFHNSSLWRIQHNIASNITSLVNPSVKEKHPTCPP